MKKLLSISLIFLSANALNLNYGWNLVGADKNINITKLLNEDNIIAWKYKDGKWEVSSSLEDIKNKVKDYTFFDKVNKNEGFWIYKKYPSISKADLKSSYYLIKKVNNKWTLGSQITNFDVENNSIIINNTPYKILYKTTDANLLKVGNSKETLYLVNSNASVYTDLINLKETKDMNYIKNINFWVLNYYHLVMFNYGKVVIKDNGVFSSDGINHVKKIVFKNGEMWIRWEDEDNDEFERYILEDVDLEKGIVKTKEISYDTDGLEEDYVYWVLNENGVNYLENSVSQGLEKIDPKTLIGKKLYKISSGNWDNVMHIFIEGIQLTSDSLIRYSDYDYKFPNITSSDLDNIKKDNCNYSYTVNYNNGKINITGKNCDGYSDEDDSNFVYKINLAGKTFDMNNFFNTTIVNVFESHFLNPFTFTKGTAYCTILWDDCWFDKDAMLDMLSKLQQIPF